MKCPFGTFAVTSGTVDCESGCFSFFFAWSYQLLPALCWQSDSLEHVYGCCWLEKKPAQLTLGEGQCKTTTAFKVVLCVFHFFPSFVEASSKRTRSSP
jgi:hypothetical protein